MKSNLFRLASIVVALMVTAPPASAAEIFDGESLAGWEGPLKFFRVEDGAIVGGRLDGAIPKNQFLATTRSYTNFDLRLRFKLLGDDTNAGIQVRSVRVPNHHEMVGYQADLGQNYWGSLYDESRRRKVLAQANLNELYAVLDKKGWNDYRIRCEGPRVKLWINGYQTVDYTEPDASIPRHGFVALQIHSGPPGEAWYKDITIEELPEPSEPPTLAEGVRGVATRAPGEVTIDGDLTEFNRAFGTPIEYFHVTDKLYDRAAQFFYMWDDEAFYAALRTLDTKPANLAPNNRLWEGDGVEWYFDTRRGENFRSRKWGEGAVHCYWVGLTGEKVASRFCLRPGYLDAIPQTGVEVAAKRTEVGMDVEFKLPWVNFPGFAPNAGSVIGVDAELCYSDGGPRVDRSFVYGSPLSVQQPASLARVQLVDAFKREYWKMCGPVLMPARCDTAWKQETVPHVTGYMALPPNYAEDIGRILFRLTDLRGSTLAEFSGKIETFAEYGQFRRAVARWPSDLTPAGGYHLVGIVYDTEQRELTRVAPRMVSVGMTPGY